MDRPPFAAPPKARSEYRSSEEYTAALARYEAYQAWLQTRNPDGEATPPAEVEGEGGPNGSEGELGRGGAPKKKPRGAPFAKGGDPRRVQEGAKSFDELTDEEREALKDAAEAVLEEAKAKAKARKGKGKGKGKAEKAKAEGAEGAEGEGDADGEPSDDDLAEGLGMGGEAPEPPEGGLILLREQGMPMTGEEAMQFLHGVAQGALPSPQQFVQVMRAVAQQEVAEHGFEGFSEADLDAIMAAVKAAGAAAPKRVEVFRAPEAPKPDWSGVVHHKFEEVLENVQMRNNILLVGPSGSGKSHLGRQVAESLGLAFSSISCTEGMSEGQLTGRLIPLADQALYLGTPFVERYEEGGVFLADEWDAANSNVVLVTNQALANGRMPLPNRFSNPVADRHEDFVFIAAANTWLMGPDAQYVGRNKLDAASENRFAGAKIEIDYDRDLERSLVPDDEELLTLFHSVRDKIVEVKLQRVWSTRDLLVAAKRRRMFPRKYSAKQALLKHVVGWRPEEVRKVGLA
jgi:MoxR-like ATPase